jgi:hypothetical protein
VLNQEILFLSFLGGEVPFIIRKRVGERLCFVGETYVHGKMDGSVLQNGYEDKLEDVLLIWIPKVTNYSPSQSSIISEIFQAHPVHYMATIASGCATGWPRGTRGNSPIALFGIEKLIAD